MTKPSAHTGNDSADCGGAEAVAALFTAGMVAGAIVAGAFVTGAVVCGAAAIAPDAVPTLARLPRKESPRTGMSAVRGEICGACGSAAAPGVAESDGESDGAIVPVNSGSGLTASTVTCGAGCALGSLTWTVCSIRRRWRERWLWRRGRRRRQRRRALKFSGRMRRQCSDRMHEPAFAMRRAVEPIVPMLPGWRGSARTAGTRFRCMPAANWQRDTGACEKKNRKNRVCGSPGNRPHDSLRHPFDGSSAGSGGEIAQQIGQTRHKIVCSSGRRNRWLPLHHAGR